MRKIDPSVGLSFFDGFGSWGDGSQVGSTREQVLLLYLECPIVLQGQNMW